METHWHTELASTNDEAKRIVPLGAPHGSLVGADYQTAGRGRSGKVWECAPGDGLMCSVILKPTWEKQYWGWVALVTGLVMAELLERDCLHPTIKWPNDILVNGKKICGILTEASGDHVIVGIGMNLNMSSLPEVESSLKPTSFFLETDCRLDARSYAMTVRYALVQALAAESPLLFREQIVRRLAWLNQRVSLQTRTESLTGELVGLAQAGQLILDIDGQSQEVYDAHDIRVVY